MGRILKMAARNIWRNTVRTGITVAAIAMGLAMIVLSYSANHGNYEAMLAKGIEQNAGHAVLQNPKWQDDPDPEFVVERSGEAEAILSEAFPEAIVTRRILAGGLITSPTNSVPIGVMGVEPEDAKELTKFDDGLLEGSAWLEGDDKRGLLMGETLAKRLDVEVGDKVVLMAPDPQDPTQSTSVLFRVRGLYKIGVPSMDAFLVVTTIQGAQPLLKGEDPAHQVALILPSDKGSEAATEKVRGLVGDYGQVLHWRQAVPDLQSFIEVDTQTNDAFFFIIGLIVVLGVVNTILMSVLERVREFGVMLAVGMRPAKLATLVLTEGFLIGVIAAVLGLIIGCLITWPLTTHGVDMTAALGDSMEMGGVAMDMVIKARFDPPKLAKYALATVVLTTLAAAWPAWRVTRLRPLEAIHHL